MKRRTERVLTPWQLTTKFFRGLTVGDSASVDDWEAPKTAAEYAAERGWPDPGKPGSVLPARKNRFVYMLVSRKGNFMLARAAEFERCATVTECMFDLTKNAIDWILLNQEVGGCYMWGQVPDGSWLCVGFVERVEQTEVTGEKN